MCVCACVRVRVHMRACELCSCHISIQSLAVLPSIYLYVDFGMLDGNVKMRRNSKNVYAKHMCSFEADSVFVQ